MIIPSHQGWRILSFFISLISRLQRKPRAQGWLRKNPIKQAQTDPFTPKESKAARWCLRLGIYGVILHVMAFFSLANVNMHESSKLNFVFVPLAILTYLGWLGVHSISFILSILTGIRIGLKGGQYQGYPKVIAGFLLPLATVFWFFVIAPNVLNLSSPRAPVISVRADMRTISTALDSYYIDNNSYPAWSLIPEENAFGNEARNNPNLRLQPTFKMRHNTKLGTLTTPVPYITSHFVDPFAPSKGATFSYYSINNPKHPENNPEHPEYSGWILWSAGPDNRYDLTIKNITKAYDPNTRMPSDYLIERTYDPTNGSDSSGDIWRVKQ